MADSPSLRRAFWQSLRRELLLSYRHKGELANPLIFFLMVVVFTPLGISEEPAMLARIAPGILWVIALLATLLSLDGLFRSDFDDGSLEQMVLSPQPLACLVLTKVFAHWLLSGVPLTLLAPLLGVMLQLPSGGYGVLVISLWVGTGSLSLIGAIGAALTVGLRKGGLLLSLIIMPFYVPVLIFGSGAVKNAIEGFPVNAELAILCAMLLGWSVVAPFAIAGALKISVRA
ncbi:MAG: heme exporter protein CcmB [Cellvibrionaceae bacterium]|nr:heme exporter protein CcmB [Cellvibrionaceae bacterium]